MDFSQIILWCPYCPELKYFETEELVADHFVQMHLQQKDIFLRHCAICGSWDSHILLHMQHVHPLFCLYCTKVIGDLPHQKCKELVQSAVPKFLLQHMYFQNDLGDMDVN